MSFSFPEALHVVYNVHGKKFVTKVSDLNSEGVAQIPYLVYVQHSIQKESYELRIKVNE